MKQCNLYLRLILPVAVIMCLTTNLVLADVSGLSKRPKIILNAETAFMPGHILSDYLEQFKTLVEKKTRGRMVVNIVAGERSEEEVNIRCSDGTIDMQATGGEPLEVFSPQYFFFNAPYVIMDYDHFQRVWDGDIGDEAKALIESEGNMVSVGTVYRGLRQMTSNKPIMGPEDIVDLRLRLPGVPTWITVWESLEATAVPVPLTGLYDALATGTAEASEGDLTQINSFSLFEVQSHLAMTNHLVAVGWIMLNKDFFDQLPMRFKFIMLWAAHRASQWATDQIIANEENLLVELQNNGMTVTQPDAEAIREKAKPAVEALFATEWPVTTWEEVLAQ